MFHHPQNLVDITCMLHWLHPCSQSRPVKVIVLYLHINGAVVAPAVTLQISTSISSSSPVLVFHFKEMHENFILLCESKKKKKYMKMLFYCLKIINSIWGKYFGYIDGPSIELWMDEH